MIWSREVSLSATKNKHHREPSSDQTESRSGVALQDWVPFWSEQCSLWCLKLLLLHCCCNMIHIINILILFTWYCRMLNTIVLLYIPLLCWKYEPYYRITGKYICNAHDTFIFSYLSKFYIFLCIVNMAMISKIIR